MKYLVLILIFSTELVTSEHRNILPLAEIPKEIRDKELLPYLLGMMNNKNIEPIEQFYVKLKKKDGRQAYEEIPAFFNQLPEKYKLLKFKTKLASLSANKEYLALLVEPTSKKNDNLLLYKCTKDKKIEDELYYQTELLLGACANMCVTSEGCCVVCLDNEKTYELKLIDTLTLTTEVLKKGLSELYYKNEKIEKTPALSSSILKHPNKEFAKNIKPLLFLNAQETHLGIVNSRFEWHKTCEVFFSMPLKGSMDFTSILQKLPFWRNQLPEKTSSSKDKELNLSDPKVAPKTLDELFRRLTIAKEIKDLDEK